MLSIDEVLYELMNLDASAGVADELLAETSIESPVDEIAADIAHSFKTKGISSARGASLAFEVGVAAAETPPTKRSIASESCPETTSADAGPPSLHGDDDESTASAT